MINIQNYVKPNRTGKAGLRAADISNGPENFQVTLTASHSVPAFSQSDEGKTIVLVGAAADGGNLYTTITTFISPTVVELAVPTSTSGLTAVSRVTIAWWDTSQDDTEAFNHAQNACAAGNGVLYCPGDVYIISSTLVASQNLRSLIGDGAGETFFVCTPSLTGTFLSIPDVPSWFSLGGAPTQGFTILGPGFQTPSTVTAWNITSNVATFTANNSFEAGQEILLQGFIGADNSTVNNNVLTVIASDATQFTATLAATTPDVSIVDTGVASLNWNGVAFTSSGADWIAIGNIEIQAFAGDAVQINDAIVGDFRKLIMSGCGQGFNDLPSGPAGGGTSLNFDSC